MARVSASGRKKAREQRRNRFKGLFGGRKTRMYLGNPYPADMLKYDKRGKPVGVKMTTDSQGPNPRPTITEDTSSDKPTKPTSSGGGGTAPKNKDGKVKKINGAKVDYKKIFSDYANAEARQEKIKKDAQAKVDALSNKKEAAPKSKVVGETKAGRRLERRIDRRARRRAFKTGAPMDSAQYDANVEAEKQLIRDRRGRRNQFLRNFASQLARGEQAKQPGKDYEGDYKEGDNFGQKGGSKENVAETAQTNENVEQNKEKLNTSSNDNSLMNTFLGTTNFAQKEFNILPEFDASNINTNLTSSFNKGIATEDSTPQKAMVKMYNAKRGR